MRKIFVVFGIVIAIIGVICVLLSIIQVPYTTTSLVAVPHSSDFSQGSFEVQGYHYYYLRNLAPFGYTKSLRINFNVTSGGGIDFRVMNETNFGLFNSSQTYFYYTVPSRPSATAENLVWNPPSSGTIYFVWDNRNTYTSKFVTEHFTYEWTEMENQEITSSKTLLSSESAYVGLLLIGCGLVMTGYGIVAKSIPQTLEASVGSQPPPSTSSTTSISHQEKSSLSVHF